MNNEEIKTKKDTPEVKIIIEEKDSFCGYCGYNCDCHLEGGYWTPFGIDSTLFIVIIGVSFWLFLGVLWLATGESSPIASEYLQQHKTSIFPQ